MHEGYVSPHAMFGVSSALAFLGYVLYMSVEETGEEKSTRTRECNVQMFKYCVKKKQGENRGNWQQKFSVKENIGNLEILPKHRGFCLLKL